MARASKGGKRWAEMSILNLARMGKFSTDRSIREYCERICGAKAVQLVDEARNCGPAGPR